MSDASQAVSNALRARLIASASVTALVPASNIVDRNARPILDPAIIIGEDQVVDATASIMRDYVRVYSTLHLWKKEPGLSGVKAISGAIRRALGRITRLDLNHPDFACSDCKVDSTRFLRDPDGVTAHGIVVINSLVHERWSATL